MNARIDTALAHCAYVAPLLRPAKTKAQYQRLVESLDAALDAGGADESNALARLAAMLGDLVSARQRELALAAGLRLVGLPRSGAGR